MTHAAFIASIEHRTAQLGGGHGMRAVIGDLYDGRLRDVMRARPGYNWRASNWTMATAADYAEATAAGHRLLEPEVVMVDPHVWAPLGTLSGINIVMAGYGAYVEALDGSARLLVGMLATHGVTDWRVWMTKEGEALVAAGGYGVTHKNASRQCKSESGAVESLKVLVGDWFGIASRDWRQGSPERPSAAMDDDSRASPSFSTPLDATVGDDTITGEVVIHFDR